MIIASSSPFGLTCWSHLRARRHSLSSPRGCLVEPAGQPQEVPSFARDVPTVRSGEPIFQFNGKDLTGFYTYLHDQQIRRSQARSSPSTTA